MKIFTSLLMGILALGVVAVPAMAESKVGVVKMQRLFEESPQAKAAQSKIETEFAPREQQQVALKKQIRDLEEKLSRDGAVMSESESSKLEREILSKRRELKRTNQEFQDDFNIRQNELVAKLQKQILQATVDTAKAEKFDVLLGQGVVYSSDAVDITDRVLDKLNKEFKAGGSR